MFNLEIVSVSFCLLSIYQTIWQFIIINDNKRHVLINIVLSILICKWTYPRIRYQLWNQSIKVYQRSEIWPLYDLWCAAVLWGILKLW